MDNQDFLKTITASFNKFLTTGSRSNEKLKILHGAIAKDISSRLNNPDFTVLSLGYNNGKEGTISGRYLNKKVDITISKKQKIIAGIGVKFVMQNYSQNSNNYFENMLGETANIRSNKIPYFQIFIIPDTLPYYDEKQKIKKWEYFTKHNVEKYLNLSKDNIELSAHTPTKTLLFVIHIPDINRNILDKKDYISYYSNHKNLSLNISNNEYGEFSSSVILNDYEKFIEKIINYINFI